MSSEPPDPLAPPTTNEKASTTPSQIADEALSSSTGPIINASGHVQELDRNFNLLSIVSVGIVTGNTWAALGGAIVISLSNGGPPGVIYQLLAVSFFYWCIAASIAELASAIPSSAGVYHWAAVTAGRKWGGLASWYAGWWNLWAWQFGASSIQLICANQVLAMWALFHDEYGLQRWHVFVVYLIINWACTAVVGFGNRILPRVNQLGLFFILGGVFITIVVCAVMPRVTGRGYASSSFVWRDWINSTGWESDGFVFLLGMLNGAFAVGTPDCVTHLAEEIPSPAHNLPLAIASQMVLGLLTSLLYLIAIFYSISDLPAILSTTYSNPLAELYHQATSSRAGALGLLLCIFLPSLFCGIGTQIAAGRVLWTLARDRATPFSRLLAKVHPTRRNPFNAQVAGSLINTVLALIYLGSSTAFNAFVGSFVILTTLSYLAAVGPHVLGGRGNVVKGPFWMQGWVAYGVHGVGCAYIVVFVVVYCFPFVRPVSVGNMNYASVMTGGLTVFVSAWGVWKWRRGYRRPELKMEMEGEGERVVDRGQ